MKESLQLAYEHGLKELSRHSKNTAFDRYNKDKETSQQILVADYIPPLSKGNPNNLGVALTTLNGKLFTAGHANVPFSIQSIIKLVNLAVALEEHGRDVVFSRVGMESSGDAFNSMVKLETSFDGLPKNPMINAGAISVCSCISGNSLDNRFQKIKEMSKRMFGGEVTLNSEVYEGESATGHRNRGMGFFMASRGIWGDISQDFVAETLELYFKSCSLEATCVQLSHLGAVLAHDGVSPTGDIILSKNHARTLRGLMVTAGMYDGSGSFAVNHGFPAKSGVGGGIVGVIPKQMGIATYSPALDPKGNSYLGQIVLQKLGELEDLFLY